MGKAKVPELMDENAISNVLINLKFASLQKDSFDILKRAEIARIDAYEAQRKAIAAQESSARASELAKVVGADQAKAQDAATKAGELARAAYEEAAKKKGEAEAASKEVELLGSFKYDPKEWVGYRDSDGAIRLTKLEAGRIFGTNEQYTITKTADGKIEIDIINKKFSGVLAFDNCFLNYKDGQCTDILGNKEKVLSVDQLKIWNETRAAKAFLEIRDRDYEGFNLPQKGGDRILQARLENLAKTGRLQDITIPPGVTQKTGGVSETLCEMKSVGDRISIGKVSSTFSGRIWLKDANGNCAMVQYDKGKAVRFVNPGNKCQALDQKTQAEIEKSVKEHLQEKIRAEEAGPAPAAAAGVPVDVVGGQPPIAGSGFPPPSDTPLAAHAPGSPDIARK